MAGQPQLTAGTLRVLAVTPRSEEAEQLRLCVARQGGECESLGSVAEARVAACREEPTGLMVAAEALEGEDGRALAGWLRSRPADLPVLLLGLRPGEAEKHPDWRRVLGDADVTLMPRPPLDDALGGWLRAALRARRRKLRLAARLRVLEDRDRFARTLVAVLGHDLRTPLAAARLSAEVILRSSSEERTRRAASRVLSSTRRMQRLIEQLLDYTRVREGGVLPLRLRETDAGEVCRAVISEQENAQSEARLCFEERGDPLGDWDPDRLAQLVEALLSNAVRQGTPGGLVETLLDGSDQDEIRVSVQYEGALPRTPEILFEPFADAATLLGEAPDAASRAGEATGLALFLAREIARCHGGELDVEADEARGATTFTARLRRRPPADH